MGQSLWNPDIKIYIPYGWGRTDYVYPQAVRQEFKALYRYYSCVYRWAIISPGCQSPLAHYIGETVNLAKRVQQYLYPQKSQMTNQRVKQTLDERCAKNLRVELHILKFDPFQIEVGDQNPVLCNTTELNDQFKRKLMENFAILTTPPGCELLNVVIDRISKSNRQARETRQMLDSPEGRKQLYEDKDVKTLLEIQNRREETDPNAQTH